MHRCTNIRPLAQQHTNTFIPLKTQVGYYRAASTTRHPSLQYIQSIRFHLLLCLDGRVTKAELHLWTDGWTTCPVLFPPFCARTCPSQTFNFQRVVAAALITRIHSANPIQSFAWFDTRSLSNTWTICIAFCDFDYLICAVFLQLK